LWRYSWPNVLGTYELWLAYPLARRLIVKLPPDALMFPCPPSHRDPFSFIRLRSPKDVTTGSVVWPASWGLRNCAYTTSGVRMKPCCLTLACLSMWLLPDVGMISGRPIAELRQAHP